MLYNMKIFEKKYHQIIVGCKLELEKKRRENVHCSVSSSRDARLAGIEIVSLIINSNGSLFVHESFTLDANVHTQTRSDDMVV